MKKSLKNNLARCLIVLMFIGGLLLSLYPTIADVYGKYMKKKLY